MNHFWKCISTSTSKFYSRKPIVTSKNCLHFSSSPYYPQKYSIQKTLWKNEIDNLPLKVKLLDETLIINVFFSSCHFHLQTYLITLINFHNTWSILLFLLDVIVYQFGCINISNHIMWSIIKMKERTKNERLKKMISWSVI